MTSTTLIFDSYLAKAIDYPAYMALMHNLLSDHKTTGPNQEKDLVDYTRLNFHRMERLNKTIALNNELLSLLQQLKQRWTWLVITEAWCGDAAQNIPLLHTISVASAGKIDVKIILRDENLALMDKYLTSGARAIPVLICIETETLTERGKWGPRPKPMQEKVLEYKKNPTQSLEEFKTLLHTWYAKDKTQAMQTEMIQYIKKWSS